MSSRDRSIFDKLLVLVPNVSGFDLKLLLNDTEFTMMNLKSNCRNSMF